MRVCLSNIFIETHHFRRNDMTQRSDINKRKETEQNAIGVDQVFTS